MLRHVAVFKWNPGTTSEDVTAVSTELHRLQSLIPEIRSFRFGPDAGINDSNWDFVVVADFDNVDDYTTYRDHPAHKKVLAETLAPRLTDRAAVQYEC